MCHTSFQQSLSPIPSHGVSEYWDNTTLNDSLQYTADDDNTWFPAEQETDNELLYNQTDEELLPFLQRSVVPLSSEEETELMDIVSYPPIADQTTNICGTDATHAEESIGFDPFHLSRNHLLQEKSPVFSNNAPEALPLVTSQVQSVAGQTLPHSFPMPERSATIGLPSQKQVRSSVLSKLSTSYQDCPSERIAREYYGNDPLPPRVLTSGMVRRLQCRKPLKSTDSDLSIPSMSNHPQPHLEANDRAVAIYSDSRYEGNRRISFPENVTGRSTSEHTGLKRIRGMTDLMAFHSKQGVIERDSSLISNVGSRIHRAKVRYTYCCCYSHSVVRNCFHFLETSSVYSYL